MIAQHNKSSRYLEAMIGVPEAAEILGVSLSEMHRIIRRESLPYIVPGKNHKRLKRADVLAYMARRSSVGVPELASVGEEDIL